jgi:hypothetical protein
LSVHNTVTDPNASMAAGRRTSTERFDMRQAPSARNTVTMTGNSSGMFAMASVTPASCRFEPRMPRRRMRTTMSVHEA